MLTKEPYITRVERPNQILDALRTPKVLATYIESSREHRELQEWVRCSCSTIGYRVFCEVTKHFMNNMNLDQPTTPTRTAVKNLVMHNASVRGALSEQELKLLIDAITLDQQRMHACMKAVEQAGYRFAGGSRHSDIARSSIRAYHRDNEYATEDAAHPPLLRILNTQVGASTQFAKNERGSAQVTPNPGAIAVITTGKKGVWHRAPDTSENERRSLVSAWMQK